MSRNIPLDSLEAAFTDEMADRLRTLVARADAGDWWAGLKVRLLLAFTPRLWDRHAILTMQAERAGLVVRGELVRTLHEAVAGSSARLSSFFGT